MATKKQVSFPVTDAEHERLKVAAAARHVSMKHLVLQAVEAVLAEEPGKATHEGLVGAASSSTPTRCAENETVVKCLKKHAPDHEKLERILERGGPKRLLGIRSNLDAFIGDMAYGGLAKEEEIRPFRRGAKG